MTGIQSGSQSAAGGHRSASLCLAAHRAHPLAVIDQAIVVGRLAHPQLHLPDSAFGFRDDFVLFFKWFV
ncbi:MAG: hypothetical protein AAB254_05095, partial [candidate division NC10 bacterium]